jgi:hypothetical protein
MFCSRLAELPTKTTASRASEPKDRRSTPAAYPLDRSAGEKVDFSGGSIGDQTGIRLIANRTTSGTRNEPRGHSEPEAALASLAIRGATHGVGWDFGKIPLFSPYGASHPQAAPSPRPGTIQTKLAIGSVDDPLEHEADRVAELVTHMPHPPPAPTVAPSQTSRVEAASREAPSVVQEVLRAPGRPLDAPSRIYFQNCLGHDFSRVRVHSDADATASARAVGALAYAVGQDLVFADRLYAPHSSAGRWLLAHELTHVIQQGAAQATTPAATRAFKPAHSMGPNRILQRQTPPAPASQVTPQVTQQLYSRAIASLASRAGVNPKLLQILRQGIVGQTVHRVQVTPSTLQMPQSPSPTPDAGALPPQPAVTFVFDLLISPDPASVPPSAFAAFVEDPANQTSFSPSSATGQTITRLLQINTRAPTSANADDSLAEALLHEGTHMVLEIDRMLSNVQDPGIAAGMTGALVAFSRYKQAASQSALRGPLDAALVSEINRVLNPSGVAAAPGVPTAAGVASATVDAILEERFAVDQEQAPFPRPQPVSNIVIANSYLLRELAVAAGRDPQKNPWPPGANTSTLIALFAQFLDDVAFLLTRQSTQTPGPSPSPSVRSGTGAPAPSGSGPRPMP